MISPVAIPLVQFDSPSTTILARYEVLIVVGGPLLDVLWVQGAGCRAPLHQEILLIPFLI